GGTGLVYLRGHSTRTQTLGSGHVLTGAFVCSAHPCRVTIASTVAYRRGAHAASAAGRRHHQRHRAHARPGRLSLRTVHVSVAADHGTRFTIGLTRGQLRRLAHRRGLRLTVTFTVRTSHGTRRAGHSFRLRVVQLRHRARRHRHR
ncbi:MAG: hypothetical protein ACRDLV_01315, partial [Solirubrobacteraceae bacterium]